MWAESADDIESAFAAGKVASLVGVESGYAISSNMAVLRTLYTMGARYVVYTRSGCTGRLCNDSFNTEEISLEEPTSPQPSPPPPRVNC